MSIARFNTCIYGICIDYLTEKVPGPEVLTAKRGIAKWEVFLHGSSTGRRFRVQVAFNVDELEGRGLAREFER